MTDKYKLILDVPAQGDVGHLALGYNELARAFKQVIEHSDPQFAIGIFGGWGSGKTTLMRAISDQLDKKDCVPVWFSAWRYEKEDHLIVPLLDIVRESILSWSDENSTAGSNAKNTAVAVAGVIGDTIHALLAGFSMKVGIPSALDMSFDANKALATATGLDEKRADSKVPRSFYHASFRAINKAFEELTKEGPSRIVVFVDDLDRCLPEGMLEVLESMKLFFDLKGFVFVVGADRRVVELSVDKRYRELLPSDDQPTAGNNVQTSPVQNSVTGAQYLRKIFQVPYGLAPVSADQIDEFLWSVNSSTELPDDQWSEIQGTVSNHLRYLIDDGGVNPREIKRFINGYTLQRKIKPYLDKDVVLALQLIATRPDWSEIQIALLSTRALFIDAIPRHIDESDVGHFATVWPSLTSLPPSFVTYLNDPNAGQKLVDFARNDNPRIEEYIFAGESTQSSEGTRFVEIFRVFGEILLNIDIALEDRAPAKKMVEACEAASNALRFGDQIDNRFLPLRTDLETLTNEIRSSEWDNLAQTPDGPPDPELPDIGTQPTNQEKLERLANGWSDGVRTMISTLQELYRAGLT